MGSGCEPAPLDGKACDAHARCVAGYTCCTPDNVCLRDDQVCVGAGAWSEPPAPAPGAALLDDATVFAFSHVNTSASPELVDDQQLIDLVPDVVVRAWAQWGPYGTGKDQYQFSYVDDCHRAGIHTFMGGATATVLLADETTTQAEFEDFATRDAAGALVPHEDIHAGLRRATLANPKYREFLIKIGKIQIDGGVDGLHFAEVNHGFQGVNALRNEGFDDYQLADFNAYLLWKYPPGSDFGALFGMTGTNTLRRDVPAGDLHANFDYRSYLGERGLLMSPLADANPLAADWGGTAVNRPGAAPWAGTFVDRAVAFRYWKQIVDELRAYAHDQGRTLLISAQGLYPFVDFQSVALDQAEVNDDGPGGTPVDYMPLADDGVHLAGQVSLRAAFAGLKARSEAMAPGAPVVLFLDGRWPRYQGFPNDHTDRADYWRIYAAEAYASGLYFAFQLRSSVGGEPEKTADELGLMPLFKQLAHFYKTNASLYHGTVPVADGAADVAAPGATVVVTDQPGQQRRLVHVVNHDYVPGGGLQVHANVAVSIASDRAPTSLTLVSPDLPGPLSLPCCDGADGRISTTLPVLEAYDVLVISYE